jgi:hypothetical protein
MSHPTMKPRIIFKFLYNFHMMIIVPILLQVLREISFELSYAFTCHTLL